MKYVGSVKLRLPPGLPAGYNFLYNVQGGKFDASGKRLYLTVDSEQIFPALSGIVVVNPVTGDVEKNIYVQYDLSDPLIWRENFRWRRESIGWVRVQRA
jgi:hypothetical protein